MRPGSRTRLRDAYDIVMNNGNFPQDTSHSSGPTVADLPHVASAQLIGMLDAKRCALVVVDVQTDFAAPFGLIGRSGGDLSEIGAAIDKIEALIATARATGATVAFMRVVTRPETDTRAMKTLMERRGRPGEEAICRSDDGGADYFRVVPMLGDIEIEKLMYNSFHQTDFDAQLRARGVDTLLMTGFSTDCCVGDTASAAFHLNYNVFVVSDASGAYEPGIHRTALELLEKNCVLLVTAEAVAAAWTA